MYLLDTCVIIDLVKGDPNTILNFKSHAPNEINISAITELELRYGIEQATKNKSKQIVQALLSEINILPFTSSEAQKAAIICNELRAKGTPIGAYDLLIGATALANDLIAVTANVKEFNRISLLKMENWRNNFQLSEKSDPSVPLF